jgi:four helix bundle protein
MLVYEKLDAWKAAHELGLAVWRVTEGWSGTDGSWLRDELRTTALTAPLRIAHGTGRLVNRSYQRYVDMALGYLMELHYLLRRSEELGVLSAPRRRELDGLRGRAVFYTTRLYASLAAGADDGV